MPQYTLVQTSAGAGIVTRALAKIQCRIEPDYSDEDALLDLYIEAAAIDIANYCNRAFLGGAYKLTADVFEDGRSPIEVNGLGQVTVTSVSYIPSPVGPRVTLSYPSDYTIAANCEGGVSITPVSAWPVGATGVEVAFTVGIATVPAPVRHAALLMIGDAWENREAASLTSFDYKANPAVRNKLAPYRTGLGT